MLVAQSCLTLCNPMDNSLPNCSVHGVTKSQTWLSDFTFTFHFHAWRRNGTHSFSCLKNLRDRGGWWAAVYGVAQSWTQLKWLSSSSSTLITYFKCVTYQQDWFSSLLLTKIKIKIKPVSKMVNQWNEMCESIMGDYVRYYSCHQILWNASF